MGIERRKSSAGDQRETASSPSTESSGGQEGGRESGEEIGVLEKERGEQAIVDQEDTGRQNK